MSKKLKQFRYYGEGDSRNSPIGATAQQYETGTIFGGVFPIAQLGIQALPGTKFYLNGSIKPIYIGASGIYDLDIKNGARVTSLGFDLMSLYNINASGTGYLLVDVLYGEEE